MLRLKPLLLFYIQFQKLNVPIALLFGLLLASMQELGSLLVNLLTMMGVLMLSVAMLFTIFVFEMNDSNRFYLYQNLHFSRLHLYGFVFLLNLIFVILTVAIWGVFS